VVALSLATLRDDKTARSPDAKSTKNPCHPEAKRGVVTRVVKEDVDSDEGGILYFLSPHITICHSAASSELVSLPSKEPSYRAAAKCTTRLEPLFMDATAGDHNAPLQGERAICYTPVLPTMHSYGVKRSSELVLMRSKEPFIFEVGVGCQLSVTASFKEGESILTAVTRFTGYLLYFVLEKYRVPRCSLRDDGRLAGLKGNTRFLATLEIGISP